MSDRLPLIFVPGLLCDAALWQNQSNALKDLIDPVFADTTRHDDIAAIARDVLATAPRRFALAGLSMGGYVALEIMRQAPERVVKLALFNTSARADTPEQQEKRRLLIAMSKAGQFKGVTPRLLPMLIHPDRIHDVALTGVVTAMAERVGRDAFFNQQTAIMNRIDSRAFLKDIRCPTLVVAGAQDALTPPELLREIAGGIAGARLEIIDHCGHLSPLEQPDAVTALLRGWIG
ncbi:MAG: alpha/beta fold hydrolase [Alphaproteobacteria bacterium]|nr:alpha/beta fold hydrolase [Alphaproteobacteria bacterium]